VAALTPFRKRIEQRPAGRTNVRLDQERSVRLVEVTVPPLDGPVEPRGSNPALVERFLA
jgi:hypothetical protein